MPDLVPEARPVTLELKRWGIKIPFVLILLGDGREELFVVIRHMCNELETDFDRQLAKIMADDDWSRPGVLIECRVPTPGGRQKMWALRKAEAAMWIGSISGRKVKESVRDKLQELKEDIKHAADQIAFGDLSGVLTVSSQPARGGVLHVGDCPRCRAPLLVVISDEGIFLKIADH